MPVAYSSRYWIRVARVLTAVLLLATLFLVQPVIAISAAVILGGFYAVTFRLLTRKRREVDENLKMHVAGSYREAQQMLSGIKPVKVHRAEEHFLSRICRPLRDHGADVCSHACFRQ